MFRPDWAGGDGGIITRVTVRDGEDKAGAREGREELCCASHDELQLRRVVVAAEAQMGPLPWVLRLDGEME